VSRRQVQTMRDLCDNCGKRKHGVMGVSERIAPNINGRRRKLCDACFRGTVWKREAVDG
jgi:hypothetical protein